jgi:very-short-patch-repair endonuclease
MSLNLEVRRKKKKSRRKKPFKTKIDLLKYTPSKKKIRQANRLRNNMTVPELSLWGNLINGFAGVFWIPQAIVVGYIADFFCPEKRIVIEIDSSFHRGRKSYDKMRDTIMSLYGIKVLRFQAKDIIKNKVKVLRKIRRVTLSRPEGIAWPARIM